jgi:hypothetical protein
MLYVHLNPEPGTSARRQESDIDPGPPWVQMTEEAFAEWLAAQPVPPPPLDQPEPNVLGFFAELSENPAIATPIGDVLAQMLQPRPNNPAHKPQAALGLGVGMGQIAMVNDPRTFLQSWHQAISLDIITPELIASVQSLAEKYHLPADFVAALNPA